MENERRTTQSELTQEAVRLGIRIGELRNELGYPMSDVQWQLVQEELLRCQTRFSELEREQEKAATTTRSRASRRSRGSKFYGGALVLLTVFLLAGALIAAAVTGVIILVKYLTSEPVEPVYPAPRAEVVKE